MNTKREVFAIIGGGLLSPNLQWELAVITKVKIQKVQIIINKLIPLNLPTNLFSVLVCVTLKREGNWLI